ncbi:putative nucleic acid-binding, replication factor A [Helianthus annuus]|uniref:Nucleic acid-binding, replication factor A n=1 Tax=Helianthus annuus TaxID=4232 RepID=A0A9K3HV66_HELAN|nr:putative nucleic acid-binding, replication factor A [Helianthus annuus]
MWYYDGCNYCKSKVEKKFETYDKDDGTSDVRDTQLYQCSNKDCNGKEVFPMSRFKIPVRVQDSTGTVTLTLFDHEAMKFVRKTAKELIQIQDEVMFSYTLHLLKSHVFIFIVMTHYIFFNIVIAN